jgi:transcriptional regulator of acetoin/glycerol metabolism
VRELENAVEHAIAVSEGRRILPSDLPTALRAPRLLPRTATPPRAETTGREWRARPGADPRDTWSLADVEREHILRVLRLHDGNSTAAARQLGISRTTLWRKLREYGIPRKSSD